LSVKCYWCCKDIKKPYIEDCPVPLCSADCYAAWKKMIFAWHDLFNVTRRIDARVLQQRREVAFLLSCYDWIRRREKMSEEQVLDLILNKIRKEKVAVPSNREIEEMRVYLKSKKRIPCPYLEDLPVVCRACFIEAVNSPNFKEILNGKTDWECVYTDAPEDFVCPIFEADWRCLPLPHTFLRKYKAFFKAGGGKMLIES